MCPGPAEHGYEAVQEIRAVLAANGHVSERKIVLGLGLGTTATRGVRDLLKDAFDLDACFPDVAANIAVDRARAEEAGEKFRSNIVTHYPSGIAAWNVLKALARTSPNEYHTLNWPALIPNNTAVLLDYPFPEIAPFLIAAFPNAVVLHSVRPSKEWARRRTVFKAKTPVPWAAYFSNVTFAMYVKGYVNSLEGEQPEMNRELLSSDFLLTHDSPATSILFSAHNMFVRCAVPPERYLQLDGWAHPRSELCVEGVVQRVGELIGCPVQRGWSPSRSDKCK